ncbi:MAG: glycosyltransferase family A protein [Planctomycetota bacterium]
MSVSVIIPAFDAASSLRRCVESALGQTRLPAEVIVIDDGSTDETAAVARAFGAPVRLLQQTNQGQGAARNAGLRCARGEFIAFLDADDWWDPEFLAACVAFLHEAPDAIAVSTAQRLRDVRGNETVRPVVPGAGPSARRLESFFRFWAEYDHVRTGSVLLRHEVVRRAGPQRDDLRISQDLEYWGYLATFGPWGYLPRPLWIGDSRAVAAASRGIREKYRRRRRLCPTVEAWQSRIVPRLAAADRPHFEVVRGRVAAGFAYAKIMAGRHWEALEIYRRYGAAMPCDRVVRLLGALQNLGRPAWWGGALALRLREAAIDHLRPGRPGRRVART